MSVVSLDPLTSATKAFFTVHIVTASDFLWNLDVNFNYGRKVELDYRILETITRNDTTSFSI